MDATPIGAGLDAAIDVAERESPFLRGLIQRRREVVDRLAADGLDAAIAGAREEGEADIARALRREREAVAVAVALADIAGIATFETATRKLSDFADDALHRAIVAAIEERTPGAPPEGFAALALGKHGSRELNYSSDIDPVLIFDPARLPVRGKEEPVEAAVRIARRVVELLQQRTSDGYVLRVDLRLRPSPEATPLALPVEAALSYYESSALPWERAAYIRARAAAGDVMLGERFLADIRPFIWRRSLDYGAITEIRAISRRIRDHRAQGQRLGPGFDVKHGRGGIREAEFFAQIHQLIHGGREPDLRAPATLDALAALGQAGRIEPATAQALGDAYRLYRTIEHRLQMVGDHQTHMLPREVEALDSVARLAGMADGGALIDALAPHVAFVGTTYDALDPQAPAGLPREEAGLDAALDATGFADPAAARTRIAGWREGQYRALRTPAAQTALEAMLPKVIAAFGKSPEPQTAINRFDDLLSRLPSAINLFRLLENRPALGRTLTDILSHAPALADALGRRADLLDALIDATAFDPPPDTPTLIRDFSTGENDDDYQAVLDRVRRKVGERRFALGVQLIEGVTDPIAVAHGYARVAEAALVTLTQATVDEFEAVHGRVRDSELVILALGRLGGGALTHASDLDLIYLFTGDHLGESDGRKPLGATHYYNRLAQRVTAALSVATPSGPLYEVDTRLRPSGAQGLLAVSTASFAQYQAQDAWTWEHMALTRARTLFGSAGARGEVDAIIRDTLDRERDTERLIADAVKMRGEMAKHKPPSSPFDVKLIGGGLVDAEFAVHVLQLGHRVSFDPRLRRAAHALAEAGLLDPGFGAAHELLTRLLVTQRLVSPKSTEPPEESKAVVARACGQESWPALLAAYDAARALIGGEWRRIAGIA